MMKVISLGRCTLLPGVRHSLLKTCHNRAVSVSPTQGQARNIASKRDASNKDNLHQLREISDRLQLNLTDDDLKAYSEIAIRITRNSKKLSDLGKIMPKPDLKYSRTAGYHPTKEENVHNAWYYKSEIVGSPEGPLHGKHVAIKDCVMVGQIPMMCGSKLLEGYTPTQDATVVQRVLDAGGTVKGKATCEDMCFSASSFTSATGHVLNPLNPQYSAGGSSSGCAALLCSGEVDMAIGSDVGGSIRVPASWCGVVGLKPTYSLVPCTGSMTFETTLDHLGPMARTVYNCALLLEVISGYDGGKDPRQHPNMRKVQSYTKQLTTDLSGIKVALLDEAFKSSKSEVADLVEESARRLTQVGASVHTVSIPMHNHGLSLGFGGVQDTSMWKFLKMHKKSRMKDLAPTVKLFCLVGESLKASEGYCSYAEAMNLVPALTSSYDKVLEDYDVIISPTTRGTAHKLPEKELPIQEYVRQALNMTSLCEAFNVTGHPALSVTAGSIQRLPVGMMIIGKHFGDGMALKVGYAWEKLREG